MDEKAFNRVYAESRNGCNEYYRHPLVRNFVYTDGVRDLADTGCWWMVDVFATEVPAVMRANSEYNGWIIVRAKDGRATMCFEVQEDNPLWVKRIEHTDLPDGTYLFEIGREDSSYVCCLISEH